MSGRRFCRTAVGLATMMVLSLQTSTVFAADDSKPDVTVVPAEWFWQGSDAIERDYAYRIDEQIYGQGVAHRNRWYDSEIAKWRIYLPEFEISTTPVTNRQYAAFIKDTGYPEPGVTREIWNSYGLVHGFEATRPFAWKNGAPQSGREDHPVVLVSWQDAVAYCQWLSQKTGETWRLPNEAEWEKAVRGPDGTFYPWGNIYDPTLLNSADRGKFDTMPVKSFPAGPYGLFDGAGQVFEWTITRQQPGARIVKGGSWDDRGCGVCRPAARHSRPEHLRHILIGFRVLHVTSKDR